MTTDEYAIQLRQWLHAHPELGGQESETRRRIVEEMKASGLTITTFSSCNGVMARLIRGTGPCIAVRADMDALPIREENDLPFKSQNDGVMHACGHDVHMAIACGTARALSQDTSWCGEVRFLFEPMEETEGGAKYMAAEGCMEGVQAIIGQHVNPGYPAGTYFCKPGFVSGASDEVHLTIRGRSCHGAYPERGVDAIVVSAEIISALQTLVSRFTSPFDPVALTLGKIQGGTAGNIVADSVELTGTLRTLRQEVRDQLHAGIRQLAEGIARASGAEAELNLIPGYGAVCNSEELYPIVERCAEQVFGREHMVLRNAASLGVESIGYFFEHAPGVYYDIGCGIGSPLHSPDFCVDESCIPSGISMQLACVRALSAYFESEDRA